MISRGKYIGEIVDATSLLQSKIATRASLGFFDINKFCEDFACELLNIVHNYNLSNLNSERSNEAGMDLGDKEKRIAFQITSDKKLSKISDTIDKITEEQTNLYDKFYILILGKKQGSYKLTDEKYAKLHFSEENIIDLSDVVSKVVYLDMTRLEKVLRLFNDKMTNLLTEFEIQDEQGNYETSYYNNVEQIATIKLNSINSFHQYLTSIGYELPYVQREGNVKKLAKELMCLPRLSREVLALLIERHDSVPNNHEAMGLELDTFMKILNVSRTQLNNELGYLSTKGLVYLDSEVESEFGMLKYVCLSGCFMSDLLCHELFQFSKDKPALIKTMVVSLDFSALN